MSEDTSNVPDVSTLQPIHPLAKWVGLEQYDDDEDAWTRVLVGGEKWWKPDEGHPQAVAQGCLQAGAFEPGLYRAVYAPDDRRRSLDPGEPFKLPLEPPEPKTEDAAARTIPLNFDKGRTPAPTPRRRGARVEAQGEADEHPPMIRMPFQAPERPLDPLSQLVYLHSLVDGQRHRDHQLTMKSMELMMMTHEERTRAMVESERNRTDTYLAMVEKSHEAERERAAREADRDATTRETIARLTAEVEELRQRDEDAASLEAELARLADEPDRAQSLMQQLGVLMQSPVGETILSNLKALWGDQQPPAR